MHAEWINCLTGVRGRIDVFPAEMLADDGTPGVTFLRSRDGSLEIRPDFRAAETRLDGNVMLEPASLETGVPAALQLGRRLIALCAAEDGADEDWAEHYRFPLWTLFETETLEAIETVRVPAELPDAFRRSGLPEKDCGASPYGLPVVFPLAQAMKILAESV